LSHSLNTPDRLKSILGAKGGGKATVFVLFSIDKEGNLSDIIIDRSVEWSADMEVIRVLKESPKWKPAFQNGRNVIYWHRQGLTFVVN